MQYIKHLVHRLAMQGWNVVVGNHRGLGGISMTVSIWYFLVNCCMHVELIQGREI